MQTVKKASASERKEVWLLGRSRSIDSWIQWNANRLVITILKAFHFGGNVVVKQFMFIYCYLMRRLGLSLNRCGLIEICRTPHYGNEILEVIGGRGNCIQNILPFVERKCVNEY